MYDVSQVTLQYTKERRFVLECHYHAHAGKKSVKSRSRPVVVRMNIDRGKKNNSSAITSTYFYLRFDISQWML